MRKILFLLSLLSTFAAAQDPSGFWMGAITVPNGELKIEVTLKNNAGVWSGTIAIPAQGLRDHELKDVSVTDRQVGFKMVGIPGEPTFDGTWAKSAKTIAGTFKQGGQPFDFSLKRAEKSDASAAPASAKIVAIPGKGAAGKWMGTLEAGPTKLRLALDIFTGDDGILGGELDSLDQGIKLAMDSVELEGGKFAFKIGNIQASFAGNMGEDGSYVAGTWAQMGQELPLTFHRVK